MSGTTSGSPIREIWVASGNAKKKAELLRLLEPLGIAVRSMSEAPVVVEIVEDRDSFAGNAEKKAVTLARAVSGYAIGDDSGLCVDALAGEPGVHSARFAGEGASDEDRNELLLAKLDDVPGEQRSARFICHICLADPDGRVLASMEESCEGRILTGPKGNSGFGYDPLFSPADLADDRCFAELSAEEKDAISHRGKALRGLREFLSMT